LVAAAPDPLTLSRTQVHTVEAADGLRYLLYVSLPRSYEAKAEQRFPVVYVLDAEYGFGITRNVIEHLSDRDHIHETLVIGIAYPGGIEGDGWLRRYRLQRTRDYTPTYSETGYPDGVQDVSGGADKFLERLETDLVPYVEGRWRCASGQRFIVGNSYGGLFAAYALLARPSLFDGAVLASPSLWYDHRFLFSFHETHPGKPSHRVFLGAGALENVRSDGDITGDVERFARLLGQDGVQIDSAIFAGESHDTAFPAEVTRGLRHILAKETSAGATTGAVNVKQTAKARPAAEPRSP
jgi:predicted alpha/beta superfamily hydrolase